VNVVPNWVRSKIAGISLEDIEPYISRHDNGEEYIDFDKIIPEPKNCDWYPWRLSHWGTKWNSHDCDLSGSDLYMSTAWSCPVNIFRKLSELLQASFEVTYADEDYGVNTGNFTADNGEIYYNFTPNGGSKEAYELYNEAWEIDCSIIMDENGDWKLDWGDDE
jgi:hypothetical protein